MNKIFQSRLGLSGLILVAILATVFVASRAVVAAEEVFTTVSTKTTYEKQTVAITDLQVNGTGNDQLDMNLHASEGSLQFSNSDGLTFDGATSGSTLQFSGTRSKINAALLNLLYSSNNPGAKTVEATLGGGDGDVYNPGNKHVYQVVDVASPGITWADAKTAAEGMTYGGVSGYLATITSNQEHTFIFNRISQDGWIGANDSATEGDWRWVTGPEAGNQFWSGNVSGSVVGGSFANWNNNGGSVEPNDSSGNEDCAEVRFSSGANGQWNDRDCLANNLSYVVEFGSPGNLPTVASTSFDITVTAAPSIAFTALSPADNSLVNSVNSLSITFNQPMSFGEGDIKVYDAVTNTVVAEMFSGDTDDNRTFNFELPETLIPGKAYYVNISDSFMEGLVAGYHGFDDKTTWNFSVVDVDGVSDETENAAPNGGDANNDGTPDSQQARVTSSLSPVNSEYVVLESSTCTSHTDVSLTTESAQANEDDDDYQYPAGLLAFTLTGCAMGGSETITQYYYGDYDMSKIVLRKYDSTTKTYTTIPGATLTAVTIGGKKAIKAVYVVVDGGTLDADGTANGTIVDPAGLGVLSTGVPNTGLQSENTIIGYLASGLGALLIVGSYFGYKRFKKNTQQSY